MRDSWTTNAKLASNVPDIEPRMLTQQKHNLHPHRVTYRFQQACQLMIVKHSALFLSVNRFKPVDQSVQVKRAVVKQVRAYLRLSVILTARICKPIRGEVW